MFLIGFLIPVSVTLCSYTGLLYYVRQIKDALDRQGNKSGNNKVEIIIIRSSIIFTITVTITWIPLILFVSFYDVRAVLAPFSGVRLLKIRSLSFESLLSFLVLIIFLARI